MHERPIGATRGQCYTGDRTNRDRTLENEATTI
jgi:hypothetical protein